MTDWSPLRIILDRAQHDHVFPAGVMEVGNAAGWLWRDAVGRLTYAEAAPAATVDTVFDLASLTKVLATTAVTMRLVDAQRLDLDTPVMALMPEWTEPGRRDVTVRDLCLHTSGLPAWEPLHVTCRGRQAFASAICAMPLAYAPRSRSVYSDPGFILLGILLEQLDGSTLDVAAGRAWIDMGPDVSAGLAFRPPASWIPRTAPTRIDDERGPIAPGDVDDTNAWALGGVGGHAGMFGTADGVGAFARALLRVLDGGSRSPFVTRETLRGFVSRGAVAGSSRALGWDTMLPTSSCGSRMSPRAFGHTGFTGTSLWIDPDAGVYVVFLTNRVHPRAQGHDAIQSVRRAVHDAAMDCVGR